MKYQWFSLIVLGIAVFNPASSRAEGAEGKDAWTPIHEKIHEGDNAELAMGYASLAGGSVGIAGAVHFSGQADKNTNAAKPFEADALRIANQAAEPFQRRVNDLDGRMDRLSAQIRTEKEKFRKLSQMPTHDTVRTETVTAAHVDDIHIRQGWFRPHVEEQITDSASDRIVMSGHLSQAALDQAKVIQKLELRLANLGHEKVVVEKKISEIPSYFLGKPVSFLSKEDKKLIEPYAGSFVQAHAHATDLLGKAKVLNKKAESSIGHGITAAVLAPVAVFIGNLAESMSYDAYISHKKEKAQAQLGGDSVNRSPAVESVDNNSAAR